MNEEKVCYIRRAGKSWERGKSHHELALNSYLSIEGEPGSNECISVPHVSGGTFVAHFSKINDIVYRFRDEYGNNVDIMMEVPARVAYINRIMDF